MIQIIKRRNRLFKIDASLLAPEANKSDTINALYAAIYDEFKGAAYNPNYKNLTPKDRMEKLNEFANSWLKERGF